jgi:DNA-binding NarL/FixJ family response regulator
VVDSRTDATAPAELTDREREVLVLLASGMANKQIARRLGISEKTVKTHLTNVFQRIGVRDRTQAALWAERHGVLRPEG